MRKKICGEIRFPESITTYFSDPRNFTHLENVSSISTKDKKLLQKFSIMWTRLLRRKLENPLSNLCKERMKTRVKGKGVEAKRLAFKGKKRRHGGR